MNNQTTQSVDRRFLFLLRDVLKKDRSNVDSDKIIVEYRARVKSLIKEIVKECMGEMENNLIPVGDKYLNYRIKLGDRNELRQEVWAKLEEMLK